jgi:hypothetical protein
MRTAIIVILLVAGGTAHANPRGMRNTGIVLSAIGMALTVAAIGAWAAAQPCPNAPSYDSCHDNAAIGGAMGGTLLGVGLAHLGVGVPLWAVGQHRMNLSVAPTADRRGGTAQLAWRF